MQEFLTTLQPWTSAFASLLSLGALGFILRVQSQLKDVYAQRVEVAKDQAAIIEERLKATEAELKRLEKINDGVNTIGASLGIEEFQDKVPAGVSIRDVGDNFSGKIAGRDINDVLNEIGESISNNEKNIGQILNNSNKLFASFSGNGPFEYRLDFLYERGLERISQSFNDKLRSYSEQGWNFYGISSDYNGTDGCLLVFRRSLR